MLIRLVCSSYLGHISASCLEILGEPRGLQGAQLGEDQPWKRSQLEEEDQGAIQYANAFGIAQDQRYNSILDLCRLMVV